MPNDFYDSSGYPSTGSAGSSAAARAEYDLIEAGFNKFPTLTANGDKPVFVNAGGTAMTAVTAASARTLLGLAIGTNVQAWDADLDAIAGLASAADKVPYFTGVGTASVATFTAAGRALVDDADATAQRVTLGLVIGTNVQAYDAELAALAGLVSAADSLPYFTGAGTASLATFTAAGRALVDDADAGAQRTTLGLGTMATQAANSVAITGGTITGITDLAVADGGTGGGTAADARTNLGVVIGTNVQAFDATLAAFATLTIAADSLTIGTGADAFSQVTFAANTFPAKSSAGGLVAKAITDFGLSLVDDANAAAGRTTLGLGTISTQADSAVSITGGTITGITDLAVADGGTGSSTAANARTALGLVIGTDVQAQDAELAAIAGLVSAADRLPYFTGAGTASLATFTAAGRAILDDADAAAQRTTLAAAGSGAVTGSGITMTTARVLGRTTAATGAIEEITVGSGLLLAAGVLSSTAGGGSVTSVDVSGGTTGLTTSGGPIVGAGTITLAGTLAVANGGTGSTTAANARTALGLAIGTNVQAFDATLLSIALLGTAADKIAYTTGVDTWAEATITTFGRSLIDDAAASDGRTTLGLVIGTNVQAYDAELAAIAGLVSAANKLPYFTGAGTADVADLTVFGRSLIDDADAAAGRTTLALGALATLATVGTAQIDNDAVTYAKIQNVSATDKLLGRSTAGAGDVEEIACTAAGRALLDDTAASDQRTTLGLGTLATLAAVDTAQIQDDAVTYAKFQNITTARVLGRTTAASGNVEELTAGAGIVFSVGTITISSVVARLDTEDQALTGGVIVTSKDLGTISSGTVTPDPGDRPLQHYTNNGAHTLGVSANGGSILVDITNGASAGAITTSGFTKVAGDAFTTTNGNKFRVHISIGNGGSLLQVQALQ